MSHAALLSENDGGVKKKAQKKTQGKAKEGLKNHRFFNTLSL
jgi:hypothetical protein